MIWVVSTHSMSRTDSGMVTTPRREARRPSNTTVPADVAAVKINDRAGPHGACAIPPRKHHQRRRSVVGHRDELTHQQLLHHGSRPFHHFAGSDLLYQSCIEFTYCGHVGERTSDREFTKR